MRAENSARNMFSDDDPGGRREAGRQKRNEIVDCEYFTLYRERCYFDFRAENSPYFYQLTIKFLALLSLESLVIFQLLNCVFVCSPQDSTDSLHCCGLGQTPH